MLRAVVSAHEVKGKWKDTQGLQVRLLRKAARAGADLNFQNCQGNTALHFASHRGDLDVVETLLSLGASPKLVNAEGNTALMYAAHGGYEEICTALLEAAAEVQLANRAGLTAETMADRKGFKTCAALIHAYELAPKQAGQGKLWFFKRLNRCFESPRFLRKCLRFGRDVPTAFTIRTEWLCLPPG